MKRILLYALVLLLSGCGVAGRAYWEKDYGPAGVAGACIEWKNDR